MMMYRVSVFILIFNLVTIFVTDGVIAQTMGNNLVDSPVLVGLDANYTNIDRFSNWTASAQNSGNVNLGFGDIPGAVYNFLTSFSLVVTALPIMLSGLGLPSSFIAIIGTVTAMIYVAGMIQLWSGRNIER